jgi:hypothetical protein
LEEEEEDDHVAFVRHPPLCPRRPVAASETAFAASATRAMTPSMKRS